MKILAMRTSGLYEYVSTQWISTSSELRNDVVRFSYFHVFWLPIRVKDRDRSRFQKIARLSKEGETFNVLGCSLLARWIYLTAPTLARRNMKIPSLSDNLPVPHAPNP